MTTIPTPFGTIAGKYPFLGTMALKNCYVELEKGGKAKYNIVRSEGMVSYSAATDTPCRGNIFLPDLNVAYSIHSSSIYKIAEGGTPTRIGTIPGIDTVEITRNMSDPPQITILCDAGVYIVTNDVVIPMTDADFPDDAPMADIVSIETIGEFTLYAYGDGRVFYSTQGDTTLISAIDFFTAEQSPDGIVKIKVDRGEIAIYGNFSIEFWNFGGADVDTPFTYRTNLQRGGIARDSVKTCDGSVMWVGQSKEGEKGVYRLDGYSATKISTNQIDRLIEGEADPSVIKSFSYGRAGHSFYCVKGSDWTRTYDAATKQWHSRESYNLYVWRAQHCFAAWNKIIFGDQETGSLYYLADDTFTENEGIMVWEITSPILHAFPRGGVVDRASFDVLVGHGVTSPTAQGYDPLMMVQKSIDGGNEWSYPREVRLGRQGDYARRVNTWRWGMFGPKGIAFRLSGSDPVGFALANMDAQVRAAAA